MIFNSLALIFGIYKITKELLSNKELLELLEYLEKHKKKDDLADSFLQSLWYISNIK